MACSKNDLESKQVMDTSHTAVEIKIKTLDSQVYTCTVDKNVSVPDLKEQVATVTGVPSENQRLICRGKVLKDEHTLSAYEVEDGHTLHLVTRPAPPSSVSTASEEPESHDHSHYDRSGHISHSVLVGTFNFPDRNNGVLPELNRILSSVLSSLQVGSYFLPPLGAGNGANGTLAEGGEHVDRISEQRAADQTISVTHPGSFDPVVGLSDSRQETSHVSGIPGVSHVRILHQAVPNAIRTLSQHVDRTEQIYIARNEQAQNLLSNSDHTAQTQSSAQPLSLSGEDWNPTAWGSLFRRVQELLGNQAAPDLQRLANQLELEPSLETTIARGNLLFTGMILEQLGRLLLNLGGTAMAISREPFQSGGVPASSAESALRQSGETVQHVDNVDVNGNMDIHIHAGFPSFLVARNLLSHAADPPSLSLSVDGIRNSIDDRTNQTLESNPNSLLYPPSLESLQAGANLHLPGHGNAEVPELFQDHLFLDGSSGSRGVLYPLLTRVQQLNHPFLFARHSSLGQSMSEIGSLAQRDLGSGNNQYLDLSVLQPVAQNEAEMATVNCIYAGEDAAPATSLHLEACDSQPEPGSGHETRIVGGSHDSQDLICPMMHVLEVLPTALREQEQPVIHEGHTANGVLVGQADAETSLQLKCTGQTRLDMEGLHVLAKDGLLLSGSHNSASAMSVDDGKICCTSREIEAFAEGLQSDQLLPFLCRTRLGHESEESCRTEDASTVTSRGTILRDFLSTLSCRKEERCHLQLSSTESAHDLSLVIENVGNQGSNWSVSNALRVSPLSSPHPLKESRNGKQALEIGLDSLGGSSELEGFENDIQRVTVKGIRPGGLHESNANDDVKGLQQFLPLTQISNRHHLSPSLCVNELEKGKALSMDSGSLLTFQEFSTAAALADNELDDLKIRIADQSFEGVPAFKRQKML